MQTRRVRFRGRVQNTHGFDAIGLLFGLFASFFTALYPIIMKRAFSDDEKRKTKEKMGNWGLMSPHPPPALPFLW
jgi:hypothetical protein